MLCLAVSFTVFFPRSVGEFLGVYAAMGFGQIFFILLASIVLALGSILASTRLHDNMLANVLRCPMSFFDTTPLGRILNRFSKDIYIIDQTIPNSLRYVSLSPFHFFETTPFGISILLLVPGIEEVHSN